MLILQRTFVSVHVEEWWGTEGSNKSNRFATLLILVERKIEMIVVFYDLALIAVQISFYSN